MSYEDEDELMDHNSVLDIFTYNKKEENVNKLKLIKNAIASVEKSVKRLDSIVGEVNGVIDGLNDQHNNLTDLLIEMEDKKPIDPDKCLHPVNARKTKTTKINTTVTCKDCDTLLSFKINN